MNTKNLISTMLFVFLFLLLSCEKKATDNNNNETGNNIKNEVNNNFDTAVIHDYRVNDVLYPKNAKLKQIISNKYGEYVDSYYEYDDFGRINKVSHPMFEKGIGIRDYEIYVYDDKSQVGKIMYYIYHNISETYIHSYDNNGNKLKTLIEQWNQTDSILYFYEENRLVREDYYDSGPFESYGIMYVNGGFVGYTEYEYNNQGDLVKENNYSRTSAPLSFSVHSYRNGLNVKTMIYVYYNVIGKTKLREIRRYYDENDNLIYLESQELSGLSSSISYSQKYEYY